MNGSFLFLFLTLTAVYGRRDNPCGDSKIPCDNGQCIGRWNWCDRGPDCTDQSDEKYCETNSFGNVPDHHCTDKHFICNDGSCIPASLRCDGEWDCQDISDEKTCDSVDQDKSTSTTSTTTSTTPYSVPSIDAGHYDRRRTDERASYNNRHQDYIPSSRDYDPNLHPPPILHPNPPPPINRDLNYDTSRYPELEYNNRRSDTHPDRSFPNNQRPNIPHSATETIPHRITQRPTTTRSRYDPDRSGYPNVQRESPTISPPRSILYAPRTSSSSTTRWNIRTPNFPPFYFAYNFTNDFEYKYRKNIKDAKAWLLTQRDKSYGWGKDTPRALIALSLITNSFQSDADDNELLRKSYQTHLGIKLLRNDTGLEKIGTTRLSMYINALLATCQDPRYFWGLNLVDILSIRQKSLEYSSFINPLIFLTLCLTDNVIPVNYLETFLSQTFHSEIAKDLHILATTAMACHAQRFPNDAHVRAKLDEAAVNLLRHMNPDDGSFGSKYSTALAAQALMSVNTSRWNPGRTLDYLAQLQDVDGSFGDMQSTYYTLIALSGRSLLHLRNTLCDPVDETKEPPPYDGPEKSVSYILKIGNPETFSIGMKLSVPANNNFFDIMKAAARHDPRFKFDYEISSGQLSIHSIASIPSDPERGMFWTLYHPQSSGSPIDLRYRYNGDIRNLIPRNDDEILFWYKSDIQSYYN